MNRKLSFLPLAFLAIVFVPIAAAQDANCDGMCKSLIDLRMPPQGAVVIDANTGKRLAGSGTYPEGSDVQLYVVNMNPYRNVYDIVVDKQDANIDRVATFLGALGNPSGLLDSLGVRTLTGAPGASADKCSGLDEDVLNAATALRTAVNDAVPAGEKLKGDLKKTTDDQKPITDALKAFLTKTDDPGAITQATCTDICKAANGLRGQIRAFKPTAGLTEATAFKKKVDAFETAVTTAKNLFDAGKFDSKPLCKAEVATALKTAADLKGDSAKYVEAATEIDKSNKAFADSAKVIDEVAANKNAFVYDSFVPGEPGAQTITVRVGRTPRGGADPKKTVVAKVDVGKPFMSISAGFGFSTVEDVTVVRQRGAKEGDATMVVEKFAEENNSSLRPSAVAMLNARLFDFGNEKTPGTFSWSVGMVVTPSNTSTSTEYITGPSFGFRDNSVVFTLGYHAARVKHLGGGFKVGDPIPSTLQGDLPTESDWEGGVMLAFTYKLR